MNKVFRTSLAVDKNLGSRWRLSVEGIFTKNINEIKELIREKSDFVMAPLGVFSRFLPECAAIK